MVVVVGDGIVACPLNLRGTLTIILCNLRLAIIVLYILRAGSFLFLRKVTAQLAQAQLIVVLLWFLFYKPMEVFEEKSLSSVFNQSL